MDQVYIIKVKFKNEQQNLKESLGDEGLRNRPRLREDCGSSSKG